MKSNVSTSQQRKVPDRDSRYDVDYVTGRTANAMHRTPWTKSASSFPSDRLKPVVKGQGQKNKSKGNVNSKDPGSSSQPEVSKEVQKLKSLLQALRTASGLEKDPKGGCYCLGKKCEKCIYESQYSHLSLSSENPRPFALHSNLSFMRAHPVFPKPTPLFLSRLPQPLTILARSRNDRRTSRIPTSQDDLPRSRGPRTGARGSA